LIQGKTNTMSTISTNKQRNKVSPLIYPDLSAVRSPYKDIFL